MQTYDALLASFGGLPTISLDQATRFFNYNVDTLAAKIDDGKINLPYFRLDDSQKAIRLVYLSDLAQLIDSARAKAANDLKKLR